MSDAFLPGSGFSTFEEADRVLVGLSGGVDSAVCVNVLRQQVKVIVTVNDEKEIREYRADQLKFRRKHGRGKKGGGADEKDLKELEKLEREDKKGGKSKLDD